MRTLIIILLFSFTSQARNLITKVPPHDGPAKYPASINLIGGKEVPSGDAKYNSIVRINTNGAGCTASVIGPRVILTAAHCGQTGATATFKIAGKQFSAKITRSGLYPGVDHDLALGLVLEEIKNVAYEQIASEDVKINDALHLYGYGCINPGGGGGNDGILREGASLVSSFTQYDYVGRKPNGAALCFGDSGGPSFINGLQTGVASKGNISDTSYFVNLTSIESRSFLTKFANDNSVEICGITKDCQGPEGVDVIVASDTLGELKFSLKADTLDPDYVKRHMKMLVSFLEGKSAFLYNFR